MNLSEINNEKLIDEVEARGYFVVVENDALSQFGDDELKDELEKRESRFIEDDDYEGMKDLLQAQGYSVYENDPVKEILTDIYHEFISSNLEQFKQCLNNLFKTKIERWL